MPVTINRTSTGETGTFGEMLNEDGSHLCFTVERPYTGDHPCIPAGIYPVTQYNSPTKGDVWLVNDVPGRSEIEIHPANWASQLLGCIAPGAEIELIYGIMGVSDSQKTFAMLKSTLSDSFQLLITENFQ